MKPENGTEIRWGRILLIIIALAILLPLTSINLFAADALRSVIIFDGSKGTTESLDDFKSVYRGPVTFTHEKHVKEYKLECGQCHHDGSGDPLTDMESDEEIDRCTDCHDQEGLLRGQALDDASPDEVLEHYPNAMHQLCISCHKEHNNRTHTLSANEACRGCHEKVGD